MRYTALSSIFRLSVLRVWLVFVALFSLGYVVLTTFMRESFWFEEEILQMSALSDVYSDPFQNSLKKDYTAFIGQLQNRQIFTSAYQAKSLSAAESDRNKANELLENLRVVGIISAAPRKVIIEDSKISKSFYLSEGEYLTDGVEVQTINKSSVILNCYGEEYELYL